MVDYGIWDNEYFLNQITSRINSVGTAFIIHTRVENKRSKAQISIYGYERDIKLGLLGEYMSIYYVIWADPPPPPPGLRFFLLLSTLEPTELIWDFCFINFAILLPPINWYI